MFTADAPRNDGGEFNSGEAADEGTRFGLMEPTLGLTRVSVRQDKRNYSACI
jgi:hypothetical protein